MIAVTVATGGGRAHVVINTTHGFVVIAFEVGCHWILLILGVHRRVHAVLRVEADKQRVEIQLNLQVTQSLGVLCTLCRIFLCLQKERRKEGSSSDI